MHYAILTYGSRGDVQPFIALAVGLQQKGHTVTLAAPENFTTFVESYGVPCFPLPGNIEEIVHTQEAIKMLKSGSTFTFIKHLQKASDKTRPGINKSLMEVCAKADVLVTSTLNLFYVATIAEKLQKKWAMIIPNPPATPTRNFPSFDFDFLNFPSYNLLTYRMLVAVFWQAYKKRVNAFRISLGLPAAGKNMLHLFDEAKILTLYNFSQHLIRRPADWEAHYQVTGFFFLRSNNPDSNHTTNELSNWLQAGEPPVYIGFGSIPIPDPVLLSAAINEILTATRYRIIFCKGWSPMPPLPQHPHLFSVDQVNHEWLLPRCMCSIFHGGAGTLAATMKAGIPPIIVSIFGDQPMWGKIIAQKKMGIHIPFRKLTAKKLLAAINETQIPAIRKNASDAGKKINDEHGIENAIEKLEAYFAQHR